VRPYINFTRFNFRAPWKNHHVSEGEGDLYSFEFLSE